MANKESTIEDVRARFHTKYTIEESGCFIWTGAITSSGYGTLSWKRQTWLAHRMAWYLEYGYLPGEIPPYDENMIDHLCKNKRCVNIAHLQAVTRAENTRRVTEHPFNREDPDLCRSGKHEWKPENMRSGRKECRLCHNDRARERSTRRK